MNPALAAVTCRSRHKQKGPPNEADAFGTTSMLGRQNLNNVGSHFLHMSPTRRVPLRPVDSMGTILAALRFG